MLDGLSAGSGAPVARTGEQRRDTAVPGQGAPSGGRSGSGPCPAGSAGRSRGRVALAQALLGSPPVLILDEPTSGVDPEQRVTLRTVLAEMTRTSIVVLSTHQTENIEALCERVIVYRRGRVRYDGRVTDLTRARQPPPVWLADQRTRRRSFYVADRRRPLPQRRRLHPGRGGEPSRRLPSKALPAAARGGVTREQPPWRCRP